LAEIDRTRLGEDVRQQLGMNLEASSHRFDLLSAGTHGISPLILSGLNAIGLRFRISIASTRGIPSSTSQRRAAR